MKHPTKKQMQKVINIMYSVLPLTFEEGAGLDMSEIDVNCDYECATVHCFGGWFAVGALYAGHLSGKLDYNDGRNLMATMLGFKSGGELEDWAGINVEIWGNERGNNMFIIKLAFQSPHRPHGARSVTDIIHHLEDVQSRLPG